MTNVSQLERRLRATLELRRLLEESAAGVQDAAARTLARVTEQSALLRTLGLCLDGAGDRPH